MTVVGVSTLSGRDRAVLRAVAAGRCQLGVGCDPVLLVDGLVCADFSTGARLVAAGLLEKPDPRYVLSPARLTAAGDAALDPVDS